MKSDVFKRAEILAEAGQFQDALMLLGDEIARNPEDWYPRYAAGQCEQLIGNQAKALDHLIEAVRLNDETYPQLLNALAIAHQSQGQYPEALNALRAALEADPGHIPSMNTLAYTQKLRGEPEKSAANYDIVLRTLAHHMALEMSNSEDNPIYKFQQWESTHRAWTMYAMQAAMFLATRDGIDNVTWPPGKSAAREEETEEHKGLLWKDTIDKEGKSLRLHFPNFFTTFRESIISNPFYTELIGDRSDVLRLLGQTEEADKLQAEAQFIESLRNSKDDPVEPEPVLSGPGNLMG
jgi:tetratricopeptide (TPR) repeat protein